jgi:hypothetical protein
MFGSFGQQERSSDSDARSDFNYSELGPKTNLNLKFRDTISELYDDDEKNAVFNSSMKKGGALHEFN